MSTAHHPLPKKNGHGGGYEKQDVGFRFAMVFVSALIAAVVVVLIFLVWFYRMVAPAPPQQATTARRLPPGPVLQANPAVDMAKFRQREEQKVSSYGWVDRNAGIAKVPVQRAMEMVAERGLPQWQAPKATQEKKP